MAKFLVNVGLVVATLGFALCAKGVAMQDGTTWKEEMDSIERELFRAPNRNYPRR